MIWGHRTLLRAAAILSRGAGLGTVVSAFVMHSAAFAGVEGGVAPVYPPAVVVGDDNLSVGRTSTIPSGAPAQAGVALVSVRAPDPSSVTAAGRSQLFSTSADARFVVFVSVASNLVAGDANNEDDVFVRDLVTGTTTLVSVNSAGTGSGNAGSDRPVLSADGRFVAFHSYASDLVAGDTNGKVDVFVRDLVVGTTALVSVNSAGTGSANGSSAGQALSADGRFVGFVSAASDLVAGDTNGRGDVFVRDLVAGTTTLVSVNSAGTGGGNGLSYPPVLSADGRFVAFNSEASDLVLGDTNGGADVFVRDLVAGTTALASVNSAGTGSGSGSSAGQTLSADGRFVAFNSEASDLVAGDTNGRGDVFVRDLVAGTTTLASVNSAGTASGEGHSQAGVMTADGRFVTFQSKASDLVAARDPCADDAYGCRPNVFVRDLVAGTTVLVSVNSAGTMSRGSGFGIGFDRPTADGRFVAFNSDASDLVAGDTNGRADVFVRDLVAGTTTLVSVNSAGTGGGNGYSVVGVLSPALSADGRFVAFNSEASDLVAGDANGTGDVFVRDLVAGTTRPVSVSAYTALLSGNNDSEFPPPLWQGARQQLLSADGRFVAFHSKASDLVAGDTNSLPDVFVHDMAAGTTTLVSVNRAGTGGGNGVSYEPLLSADGRLVAFPSEASDLVAGDTNGKVDVFVRDLVAGTTALVSVNSAGTGSGNGSSAGQTLSADGRFVAFSSEANDLVAGDTNNAQDVFVRDLAAGTTALLSVNSAGTGSGNGVSDFPVISADGRLVAFSSFASDLVAGDANETRDVFIRDLVAGTTTLVSVESAATGTFEPVLSADGRLVAFQSYALSERPDVFVRDLVAGTTTLVTVDSAGTGGANDNSWGVVLSADGRLVAFSSYASNLVAGDTNSLPDVFVRDLVAGTTTLVSVNSAGTCGGSSLSDGPVLSADGRFVAFSSDASDLVAGDTNGKVDVFLRDLLAGTTALVSVNGAGTGSGNGVSDSPVLSTDGRFVAFDSSAYDLAAGDINYSNRDVFRAANPFLVTTPPTATATPTLTPSTTAASPPIPPTSTPVPPTNTPVPPTNTPVSPHTATPSATVAATPPQTPTVTPPSCNLCGDASGDGVVTIVDALFIAQVTVNLRGTLACPRAADVDGSGTVDIVDALFVSQYTVGLRAVPTCSAD